MSFWKHLRRACVSAPAHSQAADASWPRLHITSTMRAGQPKAVAVQYDHRTQRELLGLHRPLRERKVDETFTVGRLREPPRTVDLSGISHNLGRSHEPFDPLLGPLSRELGCRGHCRHGSMLWMHPALG